MSKKLKKIAHGKSNPIVFRSHYQIGSPAAEDDDEFLFDAFLQAPHIEEALKFKSPKTLLVGRTGSGKTATLRFIEQTRPNTIRISPDELSLQYIESSDVVQVLNALGINIDQIFIALWRHVFCVELIKHRFSLTQPNVQSLITKLNPFGQKRRQAIEYLDQFGTEFWQDTSVRIKQITDHIGKSVSMGADIDLSKFRADLARGDTTSKEVRSEQQSRIQRVLSTIQLQKLADVIDYLKDDCFNEPHFGLYVIIDDLDKPFSEESIRLRLVRALIETVKKMSPIPYVKFVIAIRSDLIHEVFEKTRDNRFQSEKHEDMILGIRWSTSELFSLVEKRLNVLFKRQYTSSNVSFSDIFAEKIGHQSTREYILKRTINRPRDAISFINECIKQAHDSAKIFPKHVKDAEKFYSISRFNSLIEEWSAVYPDLGVYSKIIERRMNKRHSTFDLADLYSDSVVEDIMQDLASLPGSLDPISQRVQSMFLKYNIDTKSIFKDIVSVLFKVGLIGIKFAKIESYTWSEGQTRSVPDLDLNNDVKIQIHPMFHRRFAVDDSGDISNPD